MIKHLIIVVLFLLFKGFAQAAPTAQAPLYLSPVTSINPCAAIYPVVNATVTSCSPPCRQVTYQNVIEPTPLTRLPAILQLRTLFPESCVPPASTLTIQSMYEANLVTDYTFSGAPATNNTFNIIPTIFDISPVAFNPLPPAPVTNKRRLGSDTIVQVSYKKMVVKQPESCLHNATLHPPGTNIGITYASSAPVPGTGDQPCGTVGQFLPAIKCYDGPSPEISGGFWYDVATNAYSAFMPYANLVCNNGCTAPTLPNLSAGTSRRYYVSPSPPGANSCTQAGNFQDRLCAMGNSTAAWGTPTGTFTNENCTDGCSTGGLAYGDLSNGDTQLYYPATSAACASSGIARTCSGGVLIPADARSNSLANCAPSATPSCTAGALSWTVGAHTCTANFPSTDELNSSGVVANTAAGKAGSASFDCLATGVWALAPQAGATCVDAAGNCNPQLLNWGPGCKVTTAGLTTADQDPPPLPVAWTEFTNTEPGFTGTIKVYCHDSDPIVGSIVPITTVTAVQSCSAVSNCYFNRGVGVTGCDSISYGPYLDLATCNSNRLSNPPDVLCSSPAFDTPCSCSGSPTPICPNQLLTWTDGAHTCQANFGSQVEGQSSPNLATTSVGKTGSASFACLAGGSWDTSPLAGASCSAAAIACGTATVGAPIATAPNSNLCSDLSTPSVSAINPSTWQWSCGATTCNRARISSSCEISYRNNAGVDVVESLALGQTKLIAPITTEYWRDGQVEVRSLAGFTNVGTHMMCGTFCFYESDIMAPSDHGPFPPGQAKIDVGGTTRGGPIGCEAFYGATCNGATTNVIDAQYTCSICGIETWPPDATIPVMTEMPAGNPERSPPAIIQNGSCGSERLAQRCWRGVNDNATYDSKNTGTTNCALTNPSGCNEVFVFVPGSVGGPVICENEH